VYTAAGFVTLTRWSRTWSRVGTFPTPVHQWGGQAVASTSSSLHSSTWKTFWTQTLSLFNICTNVHFDSPMSVWLPIMDTYVLGDFTKTAITIAGIDRFYWNLAVSLQLDVALLLQNFAKIRHCLPELWKFIKWFTFFRTRCTERVCYFSKYSQFTSNQHSTFRLRIPFGDGCQTRTSLCSGQNDWCSIVLSVAVLAAAAVAVAVRAAQYQHQQWSQPEISASAWHQAPCFASVNLYTARQSDKCMDHWSGRRKVFMYNAVWQHMWYMIRLLCLTACNAEYEDIERLKW